MISQQEIIATVKKLKTSLDQKAALDELESQTSENATLDGTPVLNYIEESKNKIDRNVL